MVRILVTSRSGQQRAIDAAVGSNLMEAITSAGFDEMLAICGGSCSCATCHVIVDDADLERVGSPGADEADLLAGSAYVSGRSRLACQILVTTEHNGLSVAVAPES